jgi:hypothetical protein
MARRAKGMKGNYRAIPATYSGGLFIPASTLFMDNVCIKGERIFATQGFMLALNARANW